MRTTIKLFNIFYKNAPEFLRKQLKFLYTIMMMLLTPTIIQKMKREIDKINNIYDAVEFAFYFKYLTFSIKPIQVKNEIIKLLEILKELEPKITLEIGTAGGGTLFHFSHIADSDATILSIDLPGAPGSYPEWKMPLYKSFARNGQRIKLLRGDSHNAKTLELVKASIDGNVDFLFIDGDHTYEGVKRDFNMYSPLVKEGGIIAFHDIIPDHKTRYGIQTSSYTGGVPKFWNEIKHKHRHFEIMDDPNQDGYGIGVLIWK